MSRQLLKQGELVRDTHTIVRHLGSGAFGDVYLSRHRYMGLQAMKVFCLAAGNEALEEAYLLAKLGHPNIVRMFEANDFDRSGARYGYFTMEYVEGGTLLDCFSGKKLDLNQRLSLGRGIISGLAYAHSQTPPVIHRDISPSNILLIREEERVTAKISDFGLAKHLDTSSLVASAAGKYVYMAPESFLGIHSTATDVYSAAIVLFELLTGRHPFEFELPATATPKEVAEIVNKSRSQPVPDATGADLPLSSGWNDFFRTGLMHDYEQRPRDGSALLFLFDEIVDSGRSADRPSAYTTADVRKMIEEAQSLSQQADTLDEAIGLLELACGSDSKVRECYSDLLSLWKRGIVL
jgi:serine/threonine protein kinase